jgi:hypothetical protein
MRLRKPGSERLPGPSSATDRRATGPRSDPAGTVVTAASELVAIGREMVRIPADLYMRAAEAAGALTLRAWLFALPFLQAAWRLAGRALAVAEREITPARAAVAAAAAVGILLAASQFADYRTVAIGTDQYSGIGPVAPAPEVDQVRAGSAHAWLGIPLGLAALGVAIACGMGRWRLAWVLAPIGFLTVVLSLAIDVPNGLDEGETAIAYEGAVATLVGGFWVQVTCGVLLVTLAPILSHLLRPNGAAGAQARSGPRLRPLRPAGEARG